MSVEVDWGDFDANIAKMIVDVDRNIKIKAGKTAATKIAQKLSDNTPRSVRKASAKSQLADDVVESHLADDVTVGAVNEDGEVDVGFSKNSAWRAHFVNFGTRYQNGQHFIEKTVDESAAEAMQIYMDELKRGLNL